MRNESRFLWSGLALFLGVWLGVTCNDAVSQPFERYIVQGDVNKSRVTDLDDLSLVGMNWGETTLDKYGLTSETLAADISTYWRQTVQATLASQAALAYFETGVMANPSPAAKALTPKMAKQYGEILEKAGYDDKEIGGALAIGFAVDMPVKGQPVVTKREQVFNLLDDRDQTILLSNRTFSEVPRGGFVEQNNELEVGIPRYTSGILFNAAFPVESTEFLFDTIESSYEEASVLGIDLSVAARYAAYSGSLELGIDSGYFADRRHFKAIMVIRQSFGWRYAPSDLIEENLTELFRTRRDAALIDTEIDLTKEFGTFVAVADHPVRSLIMTIDVTTEKEESRDEMSSRLKFAFGGIGSNFDLDAALNRLKSSISEISDVSVRLDVIGGPILIDIDGQGPGQSVTLQGLTTSIAQDASLGISVKDRFDGLVNAWVAAGNITNAVPVDFVYSPVANFQRIERNPLSKGTSMRAWFKRYLEADEALQRANLILRSITRVPEEGALPEVQNITLKDDYSYLGAVEPFSAPVIPGGPNTYGTYSNYREYAANQYLDTAQLYFDLFEKGQKIASSTIQDPELFLPGEPFYQVPEFTTPLYSLGLSFGGAARPTDNDSCDADNSFCGQCLQGRYDIRVDGLELRNQSRYRLVYDFDPNFTNTDLPLCGAGASAPGGIVFTRGSGDESYRATRYATGIGATHCTQPGGCWGFWDSHYVPNGYGLTVGLLDTTLHRIVYGVGTSDSGVYVLEKAARESLNLSGHLIPSGL